MRRHLLTFAITVGLLVPGATTAFAASDDPGVIVYLRSGPDSATAGQDVVAVTPDARSFTTLVASFPRDVSLSPNGRWMAYTVPVDGQSNEVWIARTDGSGARRVHRSQHWSLRPAWSPDGRRLAFGEQWVGLHVLDLTSGDREQHEPPRCAPGAIDWSPSADRLAFTDVCDTSVPGADQHLYTFSLGDGVFRQLTGDAERAVGMVDSGPDWSPDGRRIVFTRDWPARRDGRPEVRIIEADGTGERLVAAHERDSLLAPQWSPDGRQLAFSRTHRDAGEQDNAVSVWRMNADGTGMTQVTTPPGPVEHTVVDWRILPTSTVSACPPDEVPDAGFGDVSGAHAAAVDCAVWHGLAQGRDADTYAPAAPVRRDQIASFLARLLDRAGTELPDPTDQGFTDIDGNRHADAINQLAQLGIVNGTSATTYAPAASMTRAQMAALLVRTYEHATSTTLPRALDEFDDDNGTTHEAAIDKAANAGFAAGTTLSSYQPGGDVRRDQMATFLARVSNRLVTHGRMTLPQ